MQIIVVILQLVGGLTLIPWFKAAGVSFMSFDTRKSMKQLTPWLVVVGVFVYPFIVGGSFYRAWRAIDEGSSTVDSFFWSALPVFVFLIAYFITTHFTRFYQELSNKKQFYHYTD